MATFRLAQEMIELNFPGGDDALTDGGEYFAKVAGGEIAKFDGRSIRSNSGPEMGWR